jgi:PAS domain S-box-containing protein
MSHNNDTSKFQLPGMQELMDAMTDSVFQIYSIDGTMVATNTASEKMWGAPRDLMVGKFNMIKDPENRRVVDIDDIFETVIKTQKPYILPKLVEYDGTTVDLVKGMGKKRWVQVGYYPVTGKNKQVTHIVVMHKDVTEEVEAGLELQNKAKQIEAQKNIIKNHKEMLHLMSSPLIPLSEGVLALSIAGVVNRKREYFLVDVLARGFKETKDSVSILIIDFTELKSISKKAGQLIAGLAGKTEENDFQIILTGVCEKIRETINEVTKNPRVMVSSLQAGIAYSMVFDK